ncbi:beta-ketoacyl-ACP synthase 3 [Streptomyces sp. NPDC047525]|uniref:beta-ketoacyl-ACP synthase 3 n=1 Tax=Streptomyces sp. NPDC047525 TaxID=3155264 RepID=UPI0033D3858B
MLPRTQRTEARGSRILGIGVYRPRRVVGNDEAADRTGRTAEWIVRRTGILERRYASPDETVAGMAVDAATKALADAGVTAAEIDMVLVASMSDLRQSPGPAPEVAHRIGSRAAAMDLNAACAGFSYGIGLAASMVRDGTARHVLLIGSERMTDIVDPHDPGAAFLFADGAGAVVIGPAPAGEEGIGPVVWGSDGGRGELIAHDATWTQYRDTPGAAWPAMRMAGPEVFRWAIEDMPETARKAAAAAGVALDDLDAFVPHQANLRIIDTLAERLELPPDVAVGRDVVHSGNTSSASIPLAVSRLRELGAVGGGATALFIGFGAGLTWAAQVVTLP